MSIRARLMMSGLLAVFLLFPLRPAFAATLVVDDDGEDCPGASFTTISSALLGAAPGDTIEVCNGTYAEQVTINKSLTVRAAAQQSPVVLPPVAMVTPKAIVRVTGPNVSVTIEGLTISGPGWGLCNSLDYGIRVDEGARAVIRNNSITDIRDIRGVLIRPEEIRVFIGCENGVGILVGRQFEGTTGTAMIQGNVIYGYQKAGIVVDNAGSSATISENVITGAGPTWVIAQNGVQISRGAGADVRGNTISGHFYTRCSDQDAARTGCIPFRASGLLLLEVRTNDVRQSANSFRGNQTNVQTVTDLRLAPPP